MGQQLLLQGVCFVFELLAACLCNLESGLQGRDLLQLSLEVIDDSGERAHLGLVLKELGLLLEGLLPELDGGVLALLLLPEHL